MRFSIVSIVLFLVFLLLNSSRLRAQETAVSSNEETSFFYLEEQLGRLVVTPSLKAETQREAPSNVTVITKEMIKRRGYRTLVEVCEDIPGFDFMMYNDGAGEYTSFGLTRGIGGDVGNAKILIMVDGIVQNFINFNWSNLWTYEQLFHDLDRIEVVLGPGSALYGAQAYAGVIHLITQKNYEGIYIDTEYGWQTNERDIKLMYGKKFEDFHLMLSVRKYDTDGDNGTGRYDPGSYFHNNIAPNTLERNYTADGTYQTNAANPSAGQAIPDGFNNWVNSTAFRVKLSTESTEIGVYYWDIERGSSSYVSGYEYYTCDDDHQAHRRGYHFYLKNKIKPAAKLRLESAAVYRVADTMPGTGVQYTYQFDNMRKALFSSGKQAYIEERLCYDINSNHNALLGVRGMFSRKGALKTTLNDDDTFYSPLMDSSWDLAYAGDGIGLYKEVQDSDVFEAAVYIQSKNRWTDFLSSSVGARYDGSTEFGSIINPRAGVVGAFGDIWTMKVLFGTAFRQPSNFELKSSWYSNPDLEPEKSYTGELELNARAGTVFNIRSNLFLSYMKDFIGTVSSSSMMGGYQYFNKDSQWVRGISVVGDIQVFKKLGFFGSLQVYANYIYTEGKAQGHRDGFFELWQEVERIARHKVNAGMNWELWERHVNINFRVNWVGKRKAQGDNRWLIKYNSGYAPSYIKANLVMTFRRFLDDRLEARFIIMNLFDEQFYGVGRGAAESLREEYDVDTNVNPGGFSPPYHPQPGRTFLIGLKYEF
ncbi:MAG: TonB-dependent receptor plug domain-containing protein [bacterium]|nr:TonB-dependent receptor plug domain-containing protein [bacterium]